MAEVLGFVAGLDEPGFSGNGGGARSGSELSHLRFPSKSLSFIELEDTFHLGKERSVASEARSRAEADLHGN